MRLVATIGFVIVLALSLGAFAAAPSHALSEIQTVGVGSAAEAQPQRMRREQLATSPRNAMRHRHAVLQFC